VDCIQLSSWQRQLCALRDVYQSALLLLTLLLLLPLQV
jgi:hypothetical protein